MRGKAGLIAAAIVIALTIAAYWPAMRSDFVYDDTHFVQNSRAIHGGIPLTYPRAFTLASYRVNYLLSGDRPLPYHLTNLVLHILCGWLTGILAQSVIGLSDWASFFAGSVFLLHPLQSEAVIYLSGRSELLATLFILVSVLCYAREWFIPAIMAFGLAVVSKEIGLVTPALWLLTAVRRNRYSLTMLGCMSVALIFSSISPLWHYLGVMRANMSLSTVYAVMALLARAIVPLGLTIDHDFYGIPSYAVVAAIVGYLGLVGIGLKYRRTGPGFALLWVSALTIPHILGEPAGYLAEHHMYAPMVGLSLLFGCAVQRISNPEAALMMAGIRK